MKPIYPQIRITPQENGVELFTFLRKLGTDKKWYLVPFSRRTTGTNDLLEPNSQFHAEIYKFIIRGKVTKEMVGVAPMWTALDENQDSEIFRLSPEI